MNRLIEFKRNKRGISLIEVILTMAILVIVGQILYSIYFAGSTSFSASKDLGFAQQEIRNASITLTNELRTAQKISNTDLTGKTIEIEDVVLDGVTRSYLRINNSSFGPFYETTMNVSSSSKSLNIELKDISYPSLSEVLKIYFENWDAFDFIDESNYQDLKTICYIKYEN